MPEPWQHSDDELLAGLSAAQAGLNARYRDLLRLVGGVETRGLGAKYGYADGVRLPACAQNVTHAEARRRIGAAQDVLPGRTVSGQETPAPPPETARALAEAAVSAEHVAVIRAVLAALPAHLESERPSWRPTSPGGRAPSTRRPCGPSGEGGWGSSTPTAASPVTATRPGPGSRRPSRATGCR